MIDTISKPRFMGRVPAAEMAWWGQRPLVKYRRMMRRHRRLWQFVRQYIAEHNVNRILEVGCGMIPPARAWVPQYVGVDLNPACQALQADFVTMDVSPWQGIDLFLACGVIEHTGPAYETFLTQIKRLAPHHALVSFFRPIDGRTTRMMRDERGYWLNTFREQDVFDSLAHLGMTGRIEHLARRDNVLILDATEA